MIISYGYVVYIRTHILNYY